MKTKKITDQALKTDIIFLIGKKEEIKEYFEKEVFGKKKSNLRIRESFRGKYTIEEFEKSIKSANGFANKVLFDINTGNTVLVASVFIDNTREVDILRETKNIGIYKKNLKFVFSHELRHIVDIVIDSRRMNFEDKELTANLQGWVNSEFEETRDEYFEEELPKIIKEILR